MPVFFFVCLFVCLFVCFCCSCCFFVVFFGVCMRVCVCVCGGGGGSKTAAVRCDQALRKGNTSVFLSLQLQTPNALLSICRNKCFRCKTKLLLSTISTSIGSSFSLNPLSSRVLFSTVASHKSRMKVSQWLTIRFDKRVSLRIRNCRKSADQQL